MWSADGRLAIVFNGEIYNYRELRNELLCSGYPFSTDSDTEVLLAAWSQWGVECLRRLVGMFAFTIFDAVEQTLTCVRDAFGIKPFFYTQNSSRDAWAFASELPALLSLLPTPLALNLQRAHDYLVYGSYDDQPATFFDGIEQLPSGHWLQFSLQNGQCSDPVRWWHPSIAARSDLSFPQAAQELRELFLDSIRLHLRSDVPLGAALSGGVDSSAVVCAMRHLEPRAPIHTFTFVAPGSPLNEEPWADLVNAHVGAISHKVPAGPSELAVDIDALIRSQGEPFGSTSIYAQYRVFKASREAGIIVTLDGQGADELLAGYDGYPQARLRSLLDQRRYGAATSFLPAWQQWPGRGRRRALHALVLALSPDHAGARLKQLRSELRDSWLNRRWLRDRGVKGIPSDAAPLASLSDRQGRQLASSLRSALTGQGLAALLRHADRNSMHWSLESRVPFLTTDLAEFLLSMPEEYLLSDVGETKHLFRAAMRGIVPDQILDRRDKIGFATPELAWLQALAPQIDDWLVVAKEIPFLNHEKVVAMVHDTLAGKRRFTWQVWRLINFCRWMQIFQPVVRG
jgi:asparagine synthase (glutamine-hydrolysing)